MSGTGPGSDPDPGADAGSNDSDDSDDSNDDGDSRAGVEPIDSEAEPVLDDLFAVIQQRKRELPDDSYTASLFTHEKGQDAILEKLGEETTEVLLAAKDGDREAVTRESADLVYHLLVLLAANDVDLADLRAELRARR